MPFSEGAYTIFDVAPEPFKGEIEIANGILNNEADNINTENQPECVETEKSSNLHLLKDTEADNEIFCDRYSNSSVNISKKVQSKESGKTTIDLSNNIYSNLFPYQMNFFVYTSFVMDT